VDKGLFWQVSTGLTIHLKFTAVHNKKDLKKTMWINYLLSRKAEINAVT